MTPSREVSRLARQQAHELLRKGLVEQLAYDVTDFEVIANRASWVTDRVPQMLHEYGLELSLMAEGNHKHLDPSILDDVDQAWMFRSLTPSYAVIEHHMNERDTKTGRRNQALFALGLIDSEYFKSQEVEGRLRKAFPASTDKTTLNVAQLLASFAKGDHQLLRRSPKGDAYTFADPRYRMVLRAMLRQTKEERVLKLGLYR